MSLEYEYLNESSIDDNLLCSICNDPFEKPYVTPCDHTFCYKCVEQWIKLNKSCPTCRSRISSIEKLKAVKTRLVSSMLDRLLVKCKNCNKKGIERGNFKDHLKTCRKGNKCSAADIRCPWVGRADQLSIHLNQCPYEQIRPFITEILRENHYLKEQSSQLIDRYENEMKKVLDAEEFQKENQRLKQQINQLYQKCQQLENEISHLNSKQLSNEENSLTTNRPITFDSLLRGNKLGSVPNGYAGLNWINVRYTNEENARAIRPPKNEERFSIFARGYSCVAYNDWKNPMIISSIKQTFTLHACEITSVNFSEETSKLNIIARKDKKPIYSRTVPLKYNVTKVIEFQPWVDINEVEFFVRNNYFILTWIHLEAFS